MLTLSSNEKQMVESNLKSSAFEFPLEFLEDMLTLHIVHKIHKFMNIGNLICAYVICESIGMLTRVGALCPPCFEHMSIQVSIHLTESFCFSCHLWTLEDLS